MKCNFLFVNPMNSLSQHLALSYKSRYKSLIWSFYPILGFIIALAWRGEEPSKITTILVVWIVQIIAWLIIKKAKKAHIIHSETTWIVAFSVKLLVTLFVIQYLWIPAFVGQGGHRAPPPNFDPVTYDWSGVNLAKHNLNPLFVLSRNYVGIIYYIGLIYYIFGVSTFYVGLFNTLFSLLTFLSVAGILHLISRRTKPWQLMALGMFFPELAFNNAIPAKGPLATAFLFISIFLLYSIIYKKKKMNYFLICLSLFGLLVVRTSIVAVVVAITFYVTFLNFRRNKRLLIPLFVGIVAFIIVSPIVIPMMGGSSFNPSEDLFGISSKIQDAKISAISHHIDTSDSINVLFSPNSFIQAILFVPFRSIFFLVTPFPRLLLEDLTSIFSGSFEYAVWDRNFTKLSLWCTIIAMPCLFAALFQKRCRKNRLYFYVVIPFILVLILLANGRYIIHSRYRVMLDPILLATALFGYRYGNPRRFILPTLLILLIGFLGYFYLKLIA